MKKPLLAFVLMCLFSCANGEDEQETVEQETSNFLINFPERIFGEWELHKGVTTIDLGNNQYDFVKENWDESVYTTRVLKLIDDSYRDNNTNGSVDYTYRFEFSYIMENGQRTTNNPLPRDAFINYIGGWYSQVGNKILFRNLWDNNSYTPTECFFTEPDTLVLVFPANKERNINSQTLWFTPKK